MLTPQNPVSPKRIDRPEKGRRLWWTLLALGLLASTAVLVFAYNHEQDDVNGPVATRWCANGAPLLPPAACSDAVAWSLNPNAPNVNVTGGTPVSTAIIAAFNSWQQASLNGQLMTGLSFPEGPSSNLSAPNASDCINVIAFNDPTASDFSTGTIAFTSIATSFGTPPNNTYLCPSGTRICPLPSCVIDTDIEFNPADTFSTASVTPANDFDLQSIATHEIGHMIGLDHSGLANAVMFAFGDTGSVTTRTLSVDDILAAGSVYPSVNFPLAVGTLNGTVTLSGSGILAAHVVVTNATSGTAVTDGLTNADGTYSIFVPPGSYQVIALPLQGVYNLSDFGGWACGYEEFGPPCCDPASDPTCSTAATLNPPSNYSGKFH